ncbi:phage holin family protein [Streptomyces sp. L2]|uniref:phage holin family protein n=1 Tax=Streptomyces sp. L2 TaxID=2162665 RepID=UPI001012DB11|nr:phage holin family protein [Streptomyces sp. L2]
MRTRGENAASAGGGMQDAAARLAQDTTELARQEIRAVQEEVMTALKRFGAGDALLAGAGTCGVLALWAAHETLLRGMESLLPRGPAAALLTCTYAAAAVGMGLAARGRVRSAAQATAGALDKEAGHLERQQERTATEDGTPDAPET